MDQDLVIRIGRDAIFYTILIGAPILGVNMMVGLIISIFQTATAIQEQTLTFVPKILVTLIAIAVFGSWMLQTLTDYTTRLFSILPSLG